MSVRFVDVRPRADYLAGHIPGAVWVDTEVDLTGTEGGGRHPLPSAEQFETVAGRCGIGPGTLVVAVDAGTGWAARLWWLLRHFGHDDAGVIRFAAWQGPLREVAEEVAQARFVAQARLDDLATPEELLERLGDPALLLLDARSPERYRGEVEPIDKVAGRIPGARNLFFEHAFPPPPDVLRASEIVAYCGSGVTACVDLLALSLAGRADARLYAGSWSDWSSRGLPVETG